MKSADSLFSPIQRLAHFIRDFLPAQSLQLLFPLGSFLLFLGASRAWYLLRLPQEFDAFLRQQNYQIDPNAYQRFTHAYQAWVVIEESIAMAAVRFAFFASLVLWYPYARSFRDSCPGFFFPLERLSLHFRYF